MGKSKNLHQGASAPSEKKKRGEKKSIVKRGERRCRSGHMESRLEKEEVG